MKDEYLFYGGAAMAAVSFVLILIHIFLSKIRWEKIKVQLIKEYGENAITRGKK